MQREALIQNKTLLNLICHATWRGLQLSLIRATFRIYPAAARIGTDPAAARRLSSPLLSLALSRSLARPRPVVLRSSARPRVGGIAVRPALPTRQGRGYKYPTLPHRLACCVILSLLLVVKKKFVELVDVEHVDLEHVDRERVVVDVVVLVAVAVVVVRGRLC